MKKKTFKGIKLKDLSKIAAYLKGKIDIQTIILLKGELGAGKTAFAKELAEQYGLLRNRIKSPTFTLINQYWIQENTPLYHLDLYRLNEVEQFFRENIEDMLEQPNFLIIVEWPEKLLPLLENKKNLKIIEIVIEHSVKHQEERRDFYIQELYDFKM